MSKLFIEALKSRRSYYAINKEKVISNEGITEIVGQLIKHTPSAFNSQSSRVVVLFDEKSDEFWNMTKEALRKIVPVEAFGDTEARIDGFKAGYGTVLFFEESETIEGLQEQFPLYSNNFPIWSLQSSGMLQHNVWVALELEGLGASLQHYNEIIENEVKDAFGIKKSWKLNAQMPFGGITAEPGLKEFSGLENRLFVLN